MDEYLSLFIDADYPKFIDKYLETDTLQRIFYVTQFCGCDYTHLYRPLFLYTRFFHSLVVAHMTWHFTKDKKETIAALLHDAGTPCFVHSIDYVFGDYIHQESAEKKITDIISSDDAILRYLKEDGIFLKDFEEFSNYPILENKAPFLCTDRLDGVLATCYIWLHTHSSEQIKAVYQNLCVLKNEYGNPEIGFQDIDVAKKFVDMVMIYAKELQGNKDKFVMKYISEMVKLAFQNHLICLEDLYLAKESDIVDIFSKNFSSWTEFQKAEDIVCSETEPVNHFSISFSTKKRNVIPLVLDNGKSKRIIHIDTGQKHETNKKQ